MGKRMMGACVALAGVTSVVAVILWSNQWVEDQSHRLSSNAALVAPAANTNLSESRSRPRPPVIDPDNDLLGPVVRVSPVPPAAVVNKPLPAVPSKVYEAPASTNLLLQ